MKMYRRPKSLEKLLEIREAMSAEADHDVEVFVEMVRTGERPFPRAPKVSPASTKRPVKQARGRRLVTK
jgi:hypothetical protein